MQGSFQKVYGLGRVTCQVLPLCFEPFLQVSDEEFRHDTLTRARSRRHKKTTGALPDSRPWYSGSLKIRVRVPASGSEIKSHHIPRCALYHGELLPVVASTAASLRWRRPPGNLQFYPSSLSTNSQAPPRYGFGWMGSIQPGGVAIRSGSREHGLTAGWLAAFGTVGYNNDPPLLEELGVNFAHIKRLHLDNSTSVYLSGRGGAGVSPRGT